MGKRGDSLREHILWSAKTVFLEMGFERASMDAVAARAETSKRTLYAHFESKDKLFTAVVEMAEGLFREKLGSPRQFSAKPLEALTQFCARYLQVLTYDAWIRMCRMSMAECERFPEQAGRYFNLLFTEVQERLAVYLREEFRLSPKRAQDEAETLLGQVLFPVHLKTLFGLEAALPHIEPGLLAEEIDVKRVRGIAKSLLERVAQG